MRRVRIGLRLEGLIQGVGLRPHVANLAHRHHLAGWVRKAGGAVAIEAEGSPRSIAAFMDELTTRPPARARIDAIERFDLPIRHERDFTVDASAMGATAVAVVPDAATCDDCLDELFDPTNRRH